MEIPGRIQETVERMLQSGRYATAEEVLSEAVRVLQLRDELRDAIAHGTDQLDRGERIEAEKVFEELRTVLAPRRPQ